MEDKKTAIAILLCMFIFMFWFEVVMAPYKNQAKPAAQTAASAPASPEQTTSAPQQTNTPVSVRPKPVEIQEAGETSVDLGNIEVSIGHLGARLLSYRIKNYKAHIGSESTLDLVSGTEGATFPLAVYLGSMNDDYVKYSLIEVSPNVSSEEGKYFVSSDSPLTLKFKGNVDIGLQGESMEITKSFRFSANSYVFDINVQLSKKSPDGSRVWLEWTNYDAHHTDSQRLNHNYFTLLGDNNKVKLLQLAQIEKPINDFGLNHWVSFGDKYFMSTIINPEAASDTRIGKEGNVFFYRMSGADNGVSMKVFAGPKSNAELSKAGYQLERNVDLGWFSFIAHPLLDLINIFYKILGNYGLAIVLLTLLIKGLFLPLTTTSYKSMKAMQDLQPEMKALRERIKDPTQLNKEIMGLYKKHGVNPMGGCLPMLIQLPVFLGLYNALNYSIELRHAPFALWINDLSSPERLELFGIGIPVMVLLMGASMFLQQLTTPTAADPQQKKIMMMMPIIFTISFVIFPFPSGLVLYWLVNNLISIIQQMHLRSDKNAGAFKGTVLASVAIFGVAYLLTLL